MRPPDSVSGQPRPRLHAHQLGHHNQVQGSTICRRPSWPDPDRAPLACWRRSISKAVIPRSIAKGDCRRCACNPGASAIVRGLAAQRPAGRTVRCWYSGHRHRGTAAHRDQQRPAASNEAQLALALHVIMTYLLANILRDRCGQHFALRSFRKTESMGSHLRHAWCAGRWSWPTRGPCTAGEIPAESNRPPTDQGRTEKRSGGRRLVALHGSHWPRLALAGAVSHDPCPRLASSAEPDRRCCRPAAWPANVPCAPPPCAG